MPQACAPLLGARVRLHAPCRAGRKEGRKYHIYSSRLGLMRCGPAGVQGGCIAQCASGVECRTGTPGPRTGRWTRTWSTGGPPATRRAGPATSPGSSCSRSSAAPAPAQPYPSPSQTLHIDASASKNAPYNNRCTQVWPSGRGGQASRVQARRHPWTRQQSELRRARACISSTLPRLNCVGDAAYTFELTSPGSPCAPPTAPQPQARGQRTPDRKPCSMPLT